MAALDADMTADGVFTITRVFDAPRERVWDAWTQAEQLGRWFGPKGSATTVLAFDLRPGGRLHASMDGPGGRIWARFDYREVVPPSRLAWLHGFSNAEGERMRAPFFDVWPLELLTTVVFEAEGEGTRVTLTWEPFEASEAERRAFIDLFASMKMGWSGSYEQLDALLAGEAG